jgi:hypothetical protein
MIICHDYTAKIKDIEYLNIYVNTFISKYKQIKAKMIKCKLFSM